MSELALCVFYHDYYYFSVIYYFPLPPTSRGTQTKVCLMMVMMMVMGIDDCFFVFESRMFEMKSSFRFRSLLKCRNFISVLSPFFPSDAPVSWFVILDY